ncbi:MAG: ribosome biogenesis GTPase Der [Candidatus Obscuribacterales bacterium]|nr:ribosome biogenesis GTPase Der [Candidatus Obscuribacterales bacterium]
MLKPVVAIVGRPNVGKSTFFNRCVGDKAAIVDDSPGVTRDRLYRECDWSGRDFILVDTGGLVPDSKEHISSAVSEQVAEAVAEADVIVFLVDGKSGVAGHDKDVANMLRKSKKPIILAVNKIDEPKEEINLSDFYSLGLGEPNSLSALRGSGGVGDLLDKIIGFFPPKEDKPVEFTEEDENAEPQAKKDFSLAIVGKPNVGKSSIVNVLTGTQRMIVSAEPGTTRDAIDTKFKFKGHEITLIDTAGIRRKSKVDYGIEAFSVVRSLRAISRADVVALVLDVSQPISDQDQKIGGKIEEAGKPVVLVLNKWDLIPDRSSAQMNDLIEETKRELRHLNYAEIVFTSAHTKQRLPKIVEAADRALQESTRRISTSLINQVVNEAVAITPPPASKRGTRLKVYYSTQVSVLPPTFVLFVNDNKLLTDNYKTYLERRIREAFGFSGTPIRLITRPKERK